MTKSYKALTNEDGTWYSFGTFNGNDFRKAKSSDFKSGWSRLKNKPAIAIKEAAWADKPKDGNYGLWAPDIMRRKDGKYVMCVRTVPHRTAPQRFLTKPRYFAAQDKKKITQHCIGAAIADSIEDTFHPVSDFYQCNRTAPSTGVIDPAWFRDTDGKEYVVYKTEIPNNWLEIREVANSGKDEGIKWTGNAVKLLKVNGQGFSDGNNIEAPFLFKRGGVYFLAYSTHFTMDGTYDVQYATAKNVLGPYKRVKEPLLKTGTRYGCKITGPGGASFQRFVANGDEKSTRIMFHGLAEDNDGRVVYTAKVRVNGDRLSIPPILR